MSTEQQLSPTPETTAPPPGAVEAVEAEVVETSADDAPQRDPAIEARARDLGWVPKEEFRGDPTVWRDADEFVRRGEEVLPIVRSNLQKSEQKVRQLEQQLAQRDREYAERITRIERANAAAYQHQIQQLHETYEAAKRQAVSEGDTERYDRLQAEHANKYQKLRQEAAPPEPEPPRQPQPDPVPQEVQQKIGAWVQKQQDWWNKDPRMSDLAVNVFGSLDPELSVDDRLDKVETVLAQTFPDRFKKATKPAPAPSVEGGSRTPGSSAPRGKGWADIPPDDRKQAERMLMRDGLFLPKGIKKDDATDADWAKARAAYAKEYWAQD